MSSKARRKGKKVESNSGSSTDDDRPTANDSRKSRVVVTPRTLHPIHRALPLEIYLHILSFLPQASLKCWTLVNKMLSHDASRLLFAHGITINAKYSATTNQAVPARLEWFVEAANRHRANEFKSLTICGDNKHACQFLHMFLEPTTTTIETLREFDYETDDGFPSNRLVRMLSSAMDRERVIFEHTPNLRYLAWNLSCMWNTSPKYQWPTSHTFPHLETLVWQANTYSGSWNNLVLILKMFVDSRPKRITPRIHITLNALPIYQIRVRGENINFSNHLPVMDSESMSTGYAAFPAIPFTTLMRASVAHVAEDRFAVSQSLLGSTESLVNLGVICFDQEAELLPIRHFPNLKRLSLDCSIRAQPLSDEPQLDPNLNISTIPYHSIFESFFSFNNNLTAISLKLPDTALQRYIELGQFLADTRSTLSPIPYPPQTVFLPRLQHLYLPAQELNKGPTPRLIAGLLKLHGHNLISTKFIVDTTLNDGVRGWNTEDDILRHVSVLPKLQFLTLGVVREWISARGVPTKAVYCPFSSPLSRYKPRDDPGHVTDDGRDTTATATSSTAFTSTWRKLAEKSKTILYIISYMSTVEHNTSCYAETGNSLWAVTRRTRLPSRKEGFFHKDGKKKVIGDLIKIKGYYYCQHGCELVNEVLKGYMGEGHELEGWREYMGVRINLHF